MVRNGAGQRHRGVVVEQTQLQGCLTMQIRATQAVDRGLDVAYQPYSSSIPIAWPLHPLEHSTVLSRPPISSLIGNLLRPNMCFTAPVEQRSADASGFCRPKGWSLDCPFAMLSLCGLCPWPGTLAFHDCCGSKPSNILTPPHSVRKGGPLKLHEAISLIAWYHHS